MQQILFPDTFFARFCSCSQIQEDASLNAIRRELGETTYQLLKLYDRWVVEHQQVARREAEMTRIIELFKEQMEALKGAFAGIKKEIEETSSRTMRNMVEETGKRMQTEMGSLMGKSVKDLEKMMSKAEQVIPAYEKMRKNQFIKIAVIVGLVGVLVGFGMGSYWISSNTFNVDELRQYLYDKKMSQQ